MHLLLTIGFATAIIFSPTLTPADAVTGTATYLEQMTLPPSASLEVALDDVSRTDARSTVRAYSNANEGAA